MLVGLDCQAQSAAVLALGREDMPPGTPNITAAVGPPSLLQGRLVEAFRAVNLVATDL
jgi:hypothetical protein